MKLVTAITNCNVNQPIVLLIKRASLLGYKTHADFITEVSRCEWIDESLCTNSIGSDGQISKSC